jgi:hypothetical protein
MPPMPIRLRPIPACRSSCGGRPRAPLEWDGAAALLVSAGALAVLPALAGAETRTARLLFLPMVGALACLWVLHLKKAAVSRATAVLAAAAAGWQVCAGASLPHNLAALGSGVFVYLLVWAIAAYEFQPRLQAMAAIAILISAGMLARPAVAAAGGLLGITFFLVYCRDLAARGRAASRAKPGMAGFALFLFTPAVLATLALAPVTRGRLAAGAQLARILLAPAVVLLMRWLTSRAGSPDLAFAFMVVVTAAAGQAGWWHETVAPADLFFLCTGGAAALLATSAKAPPPAEQRIE